MVQLFRTGPSRRLIVAYLLYCCYTVILVAEEAREPEHAERTYVTVQRRGVISLPAEVRRRHHLDEPGAQVEVSEREDGVIELRPQLPIPADQRWFWTEEWQRMEREVDEDVAAGRVTRYDSAEEFLEYLDSVAEGDD